MDHASAYSTFIYNLKLIALPSRSFTVFPKLKHKSGLQNLFHGTIIKLFNH